MEIMIAFESDNYGTDDDKSGVNVNDKMGQRGNAERRRGRNTQET